MKQFLTVLTLASVITTGALAGALHAQAVNIAVLDAQEVINSTNAAQRAVEQLKGRQDEAQNRIDALEAPLIERREDLERKRSAMTQEQFLAAQSELRRDINQFRAEAQAIQEELDREQIRLRRIIAETVKSEVEELAAERNYTLVLPKGLVFHAVESIDISAEVLQRANATLDADL